MTATKTLMLITATLAMAGCTLPATRQPASSPELAMLDKALEDSARSQSAPDRTSSAIYENNAAQTIKSRPPRKPDDDLNRPYSAEYNGSPDGVLRDIADTVGWRFEQRGTPDSNATVHIKGAYQPALAVLRSIGEQFPYVLVVDERSKSITLDYTRLIIDSPTANKPLIQKYSMDGGIFSSHPLAARIADGYKRKGFDCQIKRAGRKFQIQLGPFIDDGSGERKVRNALGPLKRVGEPS